MQSSGQYGVTEVPQFVVGGSQHPPHIFSLAHDMSLSPSSGHGHPGHQQQHLYSHHQQQQSKEPQLHHHHTHQQQASHSPHQQRQQHQHMQQPQQQQQQVVQQQVHQTLQQQHHQQQTVQHQHQMVHQLGLGGPDSPEAPPSPLATRPSPTGFAKQMRAVSVRDLELGHEALGQDDDGTEGEEGRSTGGNRWPRQETLLLIKIRSEMDSNFRDSGLKGPLWEDVARKLSEHGFHRSAKKCKEKFENIHKYYKKTKDGKAGRQDGKNYRFFSELDALYSGRNASTRGADAAASMLRGLDHEVMADVVTPSAFRAAENASGFAVSYSSQDNHDEPERDSDDDNRSKKRKRKESEAVAAGTSSKGMLLESLVKKLMDKQEAMQRKFLESMERREQDRIAREESWKKQGMERMNREHELRIQEHNLAATRDAALIAVLQKVTGQTLQLPQMPPHPPPQPPPPLLAVQHAAATEPRNQIQKQQQQEQHLQDEGEKDGSFDPHSKRWPTPEVHALIRFRIDMESKFQETGAKGPLWEEISRGMSSLGYSRNAKRCKEKWENVNKYYRKTKESNKKRSDKSKTCSYFQQLEALYHNATLQGTTTPVGSKPNKQAGQDQQSQEMVVPDLQQDHSQDHDQSREFIQPDNVKTVVEVLQLPAAGMDSGAADGGSASNGAAAAAHLFSSPENGSSSDPGGGGSITKKVKLKHR